MQGKDVNGFARLMLVFVAMATCARSTAYGQDEIRTKLDRKIVFDRPIDAPLGDVTEFLSDRFDVTITFDGDAFSHEKMKIPRHAGIKLRKLQEVTLDTLLRLPLSQAEAVYEVRGNTVVILPDKKDGKRRPFPPLSEARKEAIKKQRAKVAELILNVDMKIDAKLYDIVDYIEDKCQLTIFIDEFAFIATKTDSDVASARVTLERANKPLDSTMKAIMKQINGKYELWGDHIRIVPKDGNES